MPTSHSMEPARTRARPAPNHARATLFVVGACALLALPSVPGAAAAAASAPAPGATAATAADSAIVERADWGELFAARGVHGTAVLYDLQGNRWFAYNPARAESAYIPASTFKIPNSLIALETRAVKDEREVFPWDGVLRASAAWNRDTDMRSAFANSTVWFYQECARRIGGKRMRRFVTRTGYGNGDISGGIDHFWLDGALRITPIEQVRFLVRLHRGSLPFSERSMRIVRDIMVVDRVPGWTLRAKTVWAQRFTPQVGWYVGWVERDGGPWFFAINIDIREPGQARAREAILRSILQREGLEPMGEGP